MAETDWLKVTLDRIQSDIDEIKDDVKMLHEFKFKIAGGVIALSTILTLILHVISLALKA